MTSDVTGSDRAGAAHRDDPALTIGDLESRTGVASATLRAWERRFGFPTPVRTTGGQRRYPVSEVERVLRVADERRRGLTLGAAVRATLRGEGVGAGSLFAALRTAHPDLEPIRVTMRVMKALTWSIEDECLAHASRPLLYGCFQTERTFRVAGRRWRELARAASSAVVMSDFESTDSASSRPGWPCRRPRRCSTSGRSSASIRS